MPVHPFLVPALASRKLRREDRVFLTRLHAKTPNVFFLFFLFAKSSRVDPASIFLSRDAELCQGKPESSTAGEK